nr:MAG TPA: hypothetical protein [Caudoviricetes sp.]
MRGIRIYPRSKSSFLPIGKGRCSSSTTTASLRAIRPADV